MHLITGYKGEEHITSADQASYNAALWGNGEFVLERGNQFAFQIISNTKVKIKDGDIICQGRHIRLDDYEEMLIENGAQNMKRHDIIVIEYSKVAGTGVESATMKVVKGAPAETAADPDLVTGDILGGDLIHQMPLYRVKMNGINLETVEQLFDTVETLETLKNETVASVQQQTTQLLTDTENQINNWANNADAQVQENKDDITAIKNGTQSVGNASKLGGAAPSTSFSSNSIVKRDSSGNIKTGNTVYFNNDDAIVYDDSTNSFYHKKDSTNHLALDVGNFPNRTNHASTNAKDFVVGQLGWQHYGNGHTIFDASKGVTPSGTNCNSKDPQYGHNGISYPTLMGWNGSYTYGVRVDSARNAEELGGLKAQYIKGRSDSSSSNIDPNTTTSQYILTNHANSPNSGYYWYIRTQWWGEISTNSNRCQIAIGYNGGSLGQAFTRAVYNGSWSPWRPLTSNSFTIYIPHTGWVNSGNSRFPKMKQVENSWVKSHMQVDLSIGIGTSYERAEEAGIAPFTESYNGGFKVFAESVPTGSILVTVSLK